MQNPPPNSILVIGESGVGKTHYGAQLLKRLMKRDGALKMDGAPSNLEPFDAAMKCLDDGMAAEHTPMTTYIESVWPVVDTEGHKADLVWPDYGGEQLKNMFAIRRIPNAWRQRVLATAAWVFLIRLHQTRMSDDVFSKPLANLTDIHHSTETMQVSDQARMIELLQMLLYAGGAANDLPIQCPRLTVLLTCWDEMGPTGTGSEEPSQIPMERLQAQLPMFCEFLRCNWARLDVLGLSALEKPLRPRERDAEYAARGPQKYGYVVMPDGMRSADLTLPIRMILADAA